MQAIHRLVELIRLQLQGLTTNAKLLIGSLMVILVMSLFLVSIYAGRMEMAPLNLPPNLGEEARARAISYLKANQIPYQDLVNDISVPAEHRTLVLAQLVDNNLLSPEQVDFDKLILDESPFRSRSQNDRRYLIAKMNVVSTMLMMFRGIDHAKVIIDQSERGGGIGRSNIPATASVIVATAGRGLTQDQADSIANLVAGAHAGLKVENVKVTDSTTGQLYQARSKESLGVMKNLEAKLAAEEHVREKLQNALVYIPGVRVNVNAQVDTREIISQTTKFEDPKIGILDESTRNFNSQRPMPSAEPGVRSNTGASLASGGGETITDERAQTSSLPVFPRTDSQIRDTKGLALVINAAIGIPRSYFLNIYMEDQPDIEEEPDAATLEQFSVAEREKIRQYIKPLIDTSATEGAIAGTITVEMFHDLSVTGTGGAGGSMGGSGMTSGGMLSQYGVSEGLVKTLGLGGLAVVSLAMMLLMVRRATAHDELPSPEELVGIPPALADAESELIGEAEESLPALEGMEIDEEALRKQEMLEQITTMVQETPDEAAHLMRKWIMQSDD